MPKTVKIDGVGRIEFPDDMSDEEIVSAIEVDILPQFGERLQRRDELVQEQQALEAQPEPSVAALTAQEFGKRGKEAFKGALRGVAETAISVPEAIGVGAASLAELTGIGEADPTKLSTYNIAQKAREVVESALPADPEIAKEFVPGVLAPAAGQMFGFGTGALAATKGAMKVGQKIAGQKFVQAGMVKQAERKMLTRAGAMLGAAAGGSEGFKRAEAAGSTPRQAFTSFWANAGVGSLEAVTLGDIFMRANKATGGEVLQAFKTAGAEGLQEAFQGWMGNVIADVATPEEVEYLKGVGEQGGAGAILGFLGSALGLKQTRTKKTAEGEVPVLGPDEEIEAFAERVETQPLPEEREVAAFEPSPTDKLGTPEALRRENELQMVAAAAAEAPEGMVGPDLLKQLEEERKRLITFQADELLETFRLAQQRKAELGEGGRVPEGEPAIGGAEEIPGFAKTAEQKLIEREEPVFEIAPGIPEITESTPLQTVDEILTERLKNRDLKEAVGILLQLPAETSRKLIDKRLNVKATRVPLDAGSLTIFNELWENALDKTLPRVRKLEPGEVIEAPPAPSTGPQLEGFRSVPGGPSNMIMDETIAFKVDPESSLVPPPAIRLPNGDVIVGEAHNKVMSRIKPLLNEGEKIERGYVSAKTGEFLKTPLEVMRELEAEAAPATQETSESQKREKRSKAKVKQTKTDAVVEKLKKMRLKTDVGHGANPFPQIATAIWNTSIDIAIAAVKAGGTIASAINAALAHIRKNAQGYDETAVRQHLEQIVAGETQAQKGAEAASAVSDRVQAPVSVVVEEKVPGSEKPQKKVKGLVGDFYSEPILERLGRLGGVVSRVVMKENMRIAAKAKQLYGALAQDYIDEARRLAGKAFRGGSTWMQGYREVTPNAAVSRFHDVLETRARTGDWSHVPEKYRKLASVLFDANMAIGRLAEQANPDFKATGFAQRMLTSYGIDIIKRGSGKAWNAWAEALAKVNNRPLDEVHKFLRGWKAQLDMPSADATHLDKIAQDFKRYFPRAVTHIRPTKGMGWHEILVSSPFRYLEQAGQRTAHAVAFREVYPLVPDEKGGYTSSGKLEATRKVVQSELNTTGLEEFDNVMKALQGHPLDTGFTAQWWSAPDTLTGAAFRTGTEIASPLRSLMLSGSAIVNVLETLVGTATIYNGYGRAFKALARAKELMPQLKRSGMLNAAIKDFSFDPTKPLRSVSRISSNVISRAFMSDFLNELQEYTAAASARIIGDEIRAGTLSPRDKQNVISTMRQMGIATEDAKAAVEGRSPATVEVFETKSAAFMSGGNMSTAERSRLGASRVFNSLFWFHTYPMTKLNQLRQLYNTLNESIRTKDKGQIKADAEKVVKFLIGTGLQGAGTILLVRLMKAGWDEWDTLESEMFDPDTGNLRMQFVIDSFLQGFGGPLAIAARLLERVDGFQSLSSEIQGLMAPLSIVDELWDFSAGLGRYEGADFQSKVGIFLSTRTPAWRMVKQGLAAVGLSQDNVALDAAISAYYKWYRSEVGTVSVTGSRKGEEDMKAFRFHMKQAVEALKDNDEEKYSLQLGKALEIPSIQEMTFKEQQQEINRALRGKKLLSKLKDDEQRESLRKAIGTPAYLRLSDFDAMLDAQAR